MVKRYICRCRRTLPKLSVCYTSMYTHRLFCGKCQFWYKILHCTWNELAPHCRFQVMINYPTGSSSITRTGGSQSKHGAGTINCQLSTQVWTHSFSIGQWTLNEFGVLVHIFLSGLWLAMWNDFFLFSIIIGILLPLIRVECSCCLSPDHTRDTRYAWDPNIFIYLCQS